MNMNRNYNDLHFKFEVLTEQVKQTQQTAEAAMNGVRELDEILCDE